MIRKALFFIFIQPLVLLIEFIFTNMYRLFGNYGIAIIMVSVLINLLILPLYKRADAMQEQEREKQRSMEKWVKHIRKTFRGDERFMMLSTYYRQQNYRPVNAVSGSLSLLLQVPFFIAAYYYLSHVDIQGESFLFLSNLGEADRLLRIGGLAVNVMPVLMTLINFVSGMIYTKGFPLKDKLQLYLLACLFLVVLYQSPSGLVLYWTMNNLFSLFKNIVLKWLAPMAEKYKKSKRPGEEKEAEGAPKLFWLGALLLTLLLGLVIPSSVISASPAEFISLNAYQNPLRFVWLTLCTSVGVFVVWGGILYYVSRRSIRFYLEKGAVALAAAALGDYMIFGNRTGTVSPLLMFHEGLPFQWNKAVISLLTAAGLILLTWYLCRFRKVMQTVFPILLISLAGLGTWNVVSAQREMDEMNYIRTIAGEDSAGEIQPILTLSRTEKNVVVFMLDRAISDYFPYILAEKPELKKQFEGFVYYPNTISFGQYTVFASAALFGGYDYLPARINARTELSAMEKQNEALKVMPSIFYEKGFDVTVCDPPLAGYKEIPDLSIYDEYPGMKTCITMGAYLSDDEKIVKRLQDSQERNFFCYSLLKVSPYLLQKFLYDGGNYFESLKNNTQSPAFMESYTVLSNLPGLTDIREESRGGFVMIDNDTSHEPCLLQMPDYVPADDVNNGAYEDSSRFTLDGREMRMDNSFQLEHYHANMAAYLQLGKWMEYLKEQGVYDNTRIIIVSDHGRVLGQFDDLIMADDLDVEGYHPILLYKDFGSREFRISDEFMTNADVPSLALRGIEENPVNPFTGNAISEQEKEAGDLLITTSDQFDAGDGAVLDTGGAAWYRFAGIDIFDRESWKKE